MAYTPKTWECGETITAEDLNHIEQGIAENSGGGTLVIREDRHEGLNIIYDKTWTEVKNALTNGERVIIAAVDGDGNPSQLNVVEAVFRNNKYSITFINTDPTAIISGLWACSEDGYLQTEQCSGGGGDIG